MQVKTPKDASFYKTELKHYHIIHNYVNLLAKTQLWQTDGNFCPSRNFSEK